MSSFAKPEDLESAFVPHVGWLRHNRGDEVIALLRQGYFEAAEQAFFWLFLRPGDTFIDGGAHIGLYSVIAHRAMEAKGRIIAIEPSERTAAHLVANLEGNGVTEARVVRAALWDSSGSIGFVSEREGRAAYARVAFEGEEPQEDTVQTVTLSEVISGSGWDEVALVKIDVEGAEPEALKGAKSAVAKGAAPLLMVEMTERNLQRRGLTTQKLVAQIEAMGYSLFEFVPETLQLKPYRVEGPIWFKNLFACTHPKRVNARLRAAASERKAIARDILGRAAACDRFKELEELDRLRQLADVSEANRQWAERIEGLLSAEREISSGLRMSIQEIESKLVGAERLAAENRTWGERSDENLARQRAAFAELESRLAESTKTIEDNRGWAERAEENFVAQKRIADDNRAWAERMEDLLATQKAIAEDLVNRLSAQEGAHAQTRARVEQTEALLAAQKAFSDDLENQLAAKERIAQDNRAWAERTEGFLAVQKAVSDDLTNRLAATGRVAEDNRAWAERVEGLLAAQTKLAAELRGRLAEAVGEIDDLQKEIRPLRTFAARLAWLFRASRRFGP